VFAAGLLLIDVFIIWLLKLDGLDQQLLLSAARCAIQLTILGSVLTPVFNLNTPWLVALFALWMVFAAVMEVSYSRSKYRFVGEFWVVFFSLALTTSLIGTFGVGIAIKSDPLWSPHTFIPTLGMLLGNSMTGIALAITSLLTQVSENQERINYLLSLGASRMDVGRTVAVEAIRTGLVPTLNGMSMMGLVSIPGMMTGQILSGTPPQDAVKYQIVLMYGISASVGLATTLAVIVTSATLFDSTHRLRMDRIEKTSKSDAGYIRGLWKDLKELAYSLRVACGCLPEVAEHRPLLDRYGSILRPSA